MKNKLMKKIENIEAELREVKAELEKRKYAGLKTGDTFELVGKKWKILDSTESGVFCLCMESLENKKFDCSCNEWTSSNLRDYLNTEVYKKICEEIGSENIVEFDRDLFSLDGQTEYGTCKDKVSLISVDEYRKYRSLIPNFKEWWWTLTPYSTKCNNDSDWITVVAPSGYFRGNDFGSQGGVRPVCIFSSALFESEDK